MTNKEFAEKYAGQSLKYWFPPRNEKVLRVVGYRLSWPLEVLVENENGAYWNGVREAIAVVGDDVDNLRVASADIRYLSVPTETIQAPTSIGGQKTIAHYPDVCRKCGAPAYNSIFGGSVDCSKKCGV